MKAAALALAALLVPLCLAADGASGNHGAIRDARQSLDEIRHEITTDERNVERQSVRERDALGMLHRLDRRLEAARRDARTHKHNLGLVRLRLRQLQAAVDALGREETADRAFLAADLAGLYRARSTRQPLVLLASGRFFELRTRAAYLQALAAAAVRRADDLRADLGQLDRYRLEFDRRDAELERRMRRVARDQRRVELERRGREAELRDARRGRAEAAAALAGLRRSAGRLQGVLEGLIEEDRSRERSEARAEARSEREERSRGGAPSVPLVSAPGRGLGRGLPWPVQGPILSRYGKHLHPVYHIPVFNRGIQIGARDGAVVRAVAAGRVDFAGTLAGFGKLVVLDHGRGMLSVYGYGSRLLVAKGQRVAAGQALEDVGEAGDSRVPSLYFEIRKGVRARNPLHYLAPRRR